MGGGWVFRGGVVKCDELVHLCGESTLVREFFEASLCDLGPSDDAPHAPRPPTLLPPTPLPLPLDEECGTTVPEVSEPRRRAASAEVSEPRLVGWGAEVASAPPLLMKQSHSTEYPSPPVPSSTSPSASTTASHRDYGLSTPARSRARAQRSSGALERRPGPERGQKSFLQRLEAVKRAEQVGFERQRGEAILQRRREGLRASIEHDRHEKQERKAKAEEEAFCKHFGEPSSDLEQPPEIEHHKRDPAGFGRQT